ncbi:MAG: hypothetical protein ACFFB0_08560 [Promethearchaeota archaeon]
MVKRRFLLARSNTAPLNVQGGGGRNQSVKIYTTKRQKSRVLAGNLSYLKY